jgi:hypothetical protein
MPLKEFLKVDVRYETVIQAAQLTAEGVFRDKRIQIWRKLYDRENGTMDVALPDGDSIRIHIKRYAATNSLTSPMQLEMRGYHALLLEEIPTAPLVAFGKLADRRSFVIFANLDGHTPADKLIESGVSFEKILNPTADLAAKLHNHRLHHRDLYLCHFMVKIENDEVHVRLIDTARVARLANPFTRKRWIVKDLAQFWFSMTKLPITDQQRDRWLARYAEQRQLSPQNFRHAIDRKVFSIARHDQKLNGKQPNRNISIPTSR